ncbi:ATP synthase subunit C [Rhizoctonia solani]|uniref:V-type proton ATPase proteolipid subunit n=1 Tax=Rhizoctonia solani TaxID=456999 RepID=A0A8H8SVW4_9AGAM|nr:ATP synthase subunit C [Rhizoctonia solani]QRW20396.1 ATP synthase subunit C [Rhizoctonia solani]
MTPVDTRSSGGPQSRPACPMVGAKHHHPAPSHRHCGRWFYWDKELGCCVPPQPEVIDAECPPEWVWDEYETACIPAPVVPAPEQCGPSMWWWEPKACCLPTGGPSTPPSSPPEGWSCPYDWYWIPEGYCAPRGPTYDTPVCVETHTWDGDVFYCKPGILSAICTLFGFAGVAASMIFSTVGAAYGTSKAGIGITGLGTFRPELIMKSLIPVVMSGIIAVYGLVVAVLISNALDPKVPYPLFSGFIHLGAGLACGFTGLSAGYAIGIVGDSCVRAYVHESKVVGIVREVRLIVALIMHSKTQDASFSELCKAVVS